MVYSYVMGSLLVMTRHVCCLSPGKVFSYNSCQMCVTYTTQRKLSYFCISFQVICHIFLFDFTLLFSFFSCFFYLTLFFLLIYFFLPFFLSLMLGVKPSVSHMLYTLPFFYTPSFNVSCCKPSSFSNTIDS